MTSDQQARDNEAAIQLWEWDEEENTKEAQETGHHWWIDLKRSLRHPERFELALAEVKRRRRQEEHEKRKALVGLGSTFCFWVLRPPLVGFPMAKPKVTNWWKMYHPDIHQADADCAHQIFMWIMAGAELLKEHRSDRTNEL
mmetsp:Transcript_36269/g.59395  ORF Transcript_36269/g.59395 Transcript_36269/m.59395 type:complete len:142 (+) Transcript_36269:295-720(+)